MDTELKKKHKMKEWEAEEDPHTQLEEELGTRPKGGTNWEDIDMHRGEDTESTQT